MLQVALLLPQKCFNTNLSSHIEDYIGFRSTAFFNGFRSVWFRSKAQE